MTVAQDAKTSPPPTSPKANRQRKRLLIRLAALFILVGIVWLLYWLIIGQFYESTDDAYVAGNAVQVMPQISGQVRAILADETNLVKKGDELIFLNQTDADIALKNAKAQLALVIRQVNQFYHNVAQAQANVAVHQDDLEKANEDLARRQGLVVKKTISEEELRHAKIAQESAIDALKLAKQQLDAAISLAGNTDLYHHPQVNQAIVDFRNTYLKLRRTIIYAPESGYIAKRNVQVGQQVSPDTILMIIIPLEQIWVNANFKESQLQNIRINQPVTIVADAYSIKYHGKVVGLNPGTGSAFDLLPPQNATGNWIKIIQRLPVRISIDVDELKKYPLRIGLSTTVTVNTHDRSGPILAKMPSSKIIYETQDYSNDLNAADKMIDDILHANSANLPAPTLQP